jgi:hypothetical protein
MCHRPTTGLVVGITAVLVMACASAKPVNHPAAAEERRARWPDTWGIEFGMRCAADGEDVRVCTCVASRVQERWTPEQFRSLGPEALRDEVRGCRERIGGEEAK